MQIKTAIAIGSGVVIGTMIGMCVDEDKKIKLINQFKKKLIYAMTGEEWKPKKYCKYTDPYRTSFASYNKVYKAKTTENKNDITDHEDDFIESLLTFDDENQANDIKNGLEALLKDSGYFTVDDVALARGKHIDYAWNVYGWTDNMITDNIVVIPSANKKEYVIELPNPKLL